MKINDCAPPVQSKSLYRYYSATARPRTPTTPSIPTATPCVAAAAAALLVEEADALAAALPAVVLVLDVDGAPALNPTPDGIDVSVVEVFPALSVALAAVPDCVPVFVAVVLSFAIPAAAAAAPTKPL